MERFFIFFVLFSLLTGSAIAQDITAEPICFTIRNDAPYKVYGEIATDYFIGPDGTKSRHTGTFRLEKSGSIHPEKGYPTDVAEFCSSGPFFPNKSLDITLKTLIPIFSCRSNIEVGELIVKGRRKKEGGTKTWIECY